MSQILFTGKKENIVNLENKLEGIVNLENTTTLESILNLENNKMNIYGRRTF
jgi:hypothetical protein